MSNQKILFIGYGQKYPSTRIRIINLLPVLKKRGIDFDFCYLPATISERFKLFLDAKKYSYIFLQKKTLSPLEFYYLRKNSQMLIFDFDDSIFTKQEYPNEFIPGRLKRFKRMVKYSDLIIAGNTYLATIAKKYNKEVYILPSAVPIKTIYNNQKENDSPVVGWIGTKGNLKYIDTIKDVLLSVYNEVKFEFRIIADQKYDINGVKCKFIKWDERTQEKEISKFDIGINPLPDNLWTRGKCAYKVLQYMSMSVPFVASAAGMNVQLSCNKIAGFVARNNKEFENYLLLLLKDKELRKKMGQKGFELAKNYSVEKIGNNLADILLSI